MKAKLIETPYGRKTPELLCQSMDAYERQPALLAALEECLAQLDGFASAGIAANQLTKSARLAAEFGAKLKLIPAAKQARAAIAAAKG